jgi:predicted methyltransferase
MKIMQSVIASTLAMLLLFAVSAADSATAHESAIDAALASPDRPAKDREQDATRKAREVLAFAGVVPGMNVADMFSAGGYYTELVSRIVGPKGSVIAYNNAEYAKFAEKGIAERYAGNRLANVRQITEPVDALKLEPASLDVAMFVMAYHDLYWRPADGGWPATDASKLVGKLYAALKPGGVVIVQDHVDGAGADPYKGVDKVHRIDPAVVRRDFEEAGFVFDGESKALAHPDDDHTRLVFDETIRGNTDQFIYRFRKPR